MAAERIEITPALVAAAEREGQVTLQYSSPLTSMQGYAADFNKAYPKIKVNLERKAGSAGAYALLQEIQSGVHRVDVFQGTDWAANAELIDKGAFVPVEPARLADFDRTALPMAPHLYFPDINRTVVEYNPKFVTPAEADKLRTWTGILDPAFKGRLSLVEPVFGVTLAPLAYVMKAAGLGEDFLKKLKAQEPQIYLNTAQARDAVVSGQRPISWGAQWESVIMSELEKGVPVRFAYQEPTVVWGGTGWGVLAKAPHPNAARLLVGWILSRDGARATQNSHTNGLTTMTGVSDERTLMKSLVKEPWFRLPRTTWSPEPGDMIKNGPRYQETWAQIMKGRN